MRTGVVKMFDAAKGFGFIREDGGPDVFVHASALQGGLKALCKGDRVSFEAQASAKGPRAVNVSKAADESPYAEEPYQERCI